MHNTKAVTMRTFARRSSSIVIVLAAALGCATSGRVMRTAVRPDSFFMCPWPAGRVPATVSMQFDAAGGVIEVAGNRLTVPRGALSTTTYITMREYQGDQLGVEITAVPAVTFAKDAEVDVSYNSPRCPADADPGQMKVWRFDPLNGPGDELDGSKVSGKKVKGKTNRNSHYMIAN